MDKLHALISLLDDPDEIIFLSVEKELLNLNVEIVPELEKVRNNTQDVDYQLRLEKLISSLLFEDIKKRFKEWIESPTEKLLYGAYLVSRFQYPNLVYENILEKINKIRKDIWLELNNNLTALEKIRIINYFLFDVHGFSRNNSNFTAPQNSYINDVLETRQGNPLSLSIIYAVIAQSLGLPVYGVNLPKNFVLAYLDEKEVTPLLNTESEVSVLFYINPVNRGAVFGRNDILFFIHRQNLEPRLSYFMPCKNQDIVLRMLNNLQYSYSDLGNKEKSKQIRELMSLFQGNKEV
ncbi:MAG: transglutaminase-like domain-containing protein [Marinilabiliaceae bacterium]|nr:transglutaminase-like domain-containing protein [Marinilabiliaceae bacterium]